MSAYFKIAYFKNPCHCSIEMNLKLSRLSWFRYTSSNLGTSITNRWHNQLSRKIFKSWKREYTKIKAKPTTTSKQYKLDQMWTKLNCKINKLAVYGTQWQLEVSLHEIFRLTLLFVHQLYYLFIFIDMSIFATLEEIILAWWKYSNLFLFLFIINTIISSFW